MVNARADLLLPKFAKLRASQLPITVCGPRLQSSQSSDDAAASGLALEPHPDNKSAAPLYAAESVSFPDLRASCISTMQGLQ